MNEVKHRLTCRKRESGRGLVSVRVANGYVDPATDGLDRWTIFVHGYNNGQISINKTWHHTLLALDCCRVDTKNVVLFYWPGDYLRSEKLSMFFYPKIVPVAEKTAKNLATYLKEVSKNRRVPLQLSFVAHSLGSLVVLETVKLLRTTHANVKVRDLLLMAAAVPEGFCIPHEAYARRFSRETNEAVLYSLDDDVLKLFFQVGQEIANRLPEYRRRAVGRSGGPGVGNGERWSTASHMDGFGHSDYWTNGRAIQRIARIVSQNRLGFSQESKLRQPQESRPVKHEFNLRQDKINEDDYLQ